MEEHLKNEKKRLRITLRIMTQSLPDEYIERSDRGIAHHLLALEQWKQAHTVFIYISTGREPQTRGVIQAALEEGKAVAIPRCLGEGEMEARIITSLDGLRPGRFGILEPDAFSRLLLPQDVDLAIAPCIAADRQGYRLGHGGGYYDRYLARIQCPGVCLCRERLLSALPRGAHDRPVDIVITENEFINCK